MRARRNSEVNSPSAPIYAVHVVTGPLHEEVETHTGVILAAPGTYVFVSESDPLDAFATHPNDFPLFYTLI